MRILGIDPGLATVGIGVVEKTADVTREIQAIDWCTIETTPARSSGQRLREIVEDLREILSEHEPAFVVVEKLFFATNQKTAIDVAQARGVILLAIAEFALPVLEPTPLQLKLAITGDGQADKRQVQDMLTRTLGLSEHALEGSPDDAVDALALATYGAVFQKELFELTVPEVGSR